MIISDKIYTVEEFADIAAQHPDKLLELINGRIVEKVTSEEHGAIALNIGTKLNLWKAEHKIKGNAGVEISHRLPDDERNERRPDVSFRYAESISKDTALQQMPDFAVEIKSRNNTNKELREKIKFFIDNGTRLAWIVFPDTRTVEVYTPDTDSQQFTDSDTLDGDDVLPGFTMAVRDIFDM